MFDQATRLGSMTTLWVLTCQRHGTSLPHGLVHYKLRGLSEQAALDQLAAWRPDLEVLSIEREPTTGQPVRLGETMATERW